MNSFDLLKWAFDLRDVKPLEKLIAIYFASRVGCNETGRAEMALDIVELGEWCGCKKEEAYHTVIAMEKFGWEVVETEPFRRLHVAFRLSIEGHPVRSSPVIETITLYVVATDQAVKIGITRDLSARLVNLASASPLKLRVCLRASGPRDVISYVERGCHAELSPHRIQGEWFSCSVGTAMQVARDWLRKVGIEPAKK